MWKEKTDNNLDIETIASSDLSSYQQYDENWKYFIDQKVLEKTIKDKEWNIYKLIPQEVEFASKYWLPLIKFNYICILRNILSN